LYGTLQIQALFKTLGYEGAIINTCTLEEHTSTHDDSTSAVLQVVSMEKMVVVEPFLIDGVFIVSFYGGVV